MGMDMRGFFSVIYLLLLFFSFYFSSSSSSSWRALAWISNIWEGTCLMGKTDT